MITRKLAFALAGAAIAMQAGTAAAVGSWAFDDPFWKQPIDRTSQAVHVEEQRQAFDYLTRTSPL